jgi:hypothetical protein
MSRVIVDDVGALNDAIGGGWRVMDDGTPNATGPSSDNS